MRTKFAALITICLVLGGMWLSSYAQMEPKMMKDASGDSMKLQCRCMMDTIIYPDSLLIISALKEELSLSENQVKKLNAIEGKAKAEAKNVLTDEQHKKFKTLTKGWKPQNMMQMMQMTQKEKK